MEYFYLDNLQLLPQSHLIDSTVYLLVCNLLLMENAKIHLINQHKYFSLVNIVSFHFEFNHVVFCITLPFNLTQITM